MKIKKMMCLIAAMTTVIGSSVTAFASEPARDPNLVISTLEDVSMPDNILVVTPRGSVTYDTESDIDWNQGYRSVWGSCQASQGSIKLDSYSRARFETLDGDPYLDSGRQWSKGGGKSFARSGWELFDMLNSGVAHTYYGIDVE